jgi:hypothetical protein
MKKDKALADQNLRKFVTQVVQTELVWGLNCEEGWANADSHEFDDTLVYPFWSEKRLATVCSVEEWRIFQPATLDLPEFLENWCVGMYKEYIMAGVNWEADLFGKEVEPLELAFLILDELKAQGKTLQFKLYESQQEFETLLREVAAEH